MATSRCHMGISRTEPSRMTSGPLGGEPSRSNLHPRLPCYQADLDGYELCRLQRGKADEDVHDTPFNVVLGGCLPVAFYEVGLLCVVPREAPCRNRMCRNAPPMRRICARIGSSFGS